MKHRFLPVLLAIIAGASFLTACSPAKKAADPGEAVNRVYPAGEGKYYSPSEAESTNPETTVAPSTQAATQAATKKPKATAATAATTSPTQPTTIQANVPRDNVTAANLNPNLAAIQGRVAAELDELAVQGISLSAKSLTLEVGESKELTLSFKPENALVKTTTLKMSNANASATASGTTITVKGVKAGTATLTVTSSNGHRAVCDVTVKRTERVITDDTVLPHNELCTAANVNRWCEAVQAHLASLGMTHNPLLNGSSAVLTTEGVDNMSYNTAAESFAAQAESALSAQTGGEWSGYEFNCFTEALSGGEFGITIVINTVE